MNTEIIQKKLAIVKLLYNQGVQQSRYTGHSSSFSILSFHDSVEMFLKYLCQLKDVNCSNLNFMEYWVKFPGLTLKEAMRSLNQQRVNLKHKGILVSELEIDFCLVNTTEFFKQNTKPFFGVDWTEISLASLIKFEETKKYMQKATLAFNNSNREACIENTALAFNSLVHEFESNKINVYGLSPFTFGTRSKLADPSKLNLESTRTVEYLNQVNRSIKELQETMKIVAMGINFSEYSKFRLLTPIITRIRDQHLVAELMNEKNWSLDNCKFCIEFVINSALNLQNSNYDVEDLENFDLTVQKFR